MPDPLDPIDREALDAALRDAEAGSVPPGSCYTRGVHDLLRLLGLIPPGEVGTLVIASLRAHLADGLPAGLAWDALDAPAPPALRGADVLRAVEAARLAAAPHPTPGRSVRVVQAVIKARRGAHDLYLMQFDAHAGRYQPIGGKVDPGDADAEAALRREIGEELGLDAPPGPAACALARLCQGWQTLALSATYGILTAYEMDFYAVSEVRFSIRTGPDTRWLSREEIAALRAADGRAISPVYEQAFGGMAALDALPPGIVLDEE